MSGISSSSKSAVFRAQHILKGDQPYQEILFRGLRSYVFYHSVDQVVGVTKFGSVFLERGFIGRDRSDT